MGRCGKPLWREHQHNALMLGGGQFLGPVGMLLVGAGASWRPADGCCSCPCCHCWELGLFHDNHGIHSVGNIHY